MTKHTSNSHFMFVTHECFAILFFLPSCCVNSLLQENSLFLSYQILIIKNGQSSTKPPMEGLNLFKESHWKLHGLNFIHVQG